MTHESTGRKRRRCIEELELIHGFPKDYTYQACNAKRRRQFPVEYEDARGALIGNCFSPLVLAFFVGELLYAMDYIQSPLDVDQLVAQRIRLIPTDRAFTLTSAPFDAFVASREELLLRMVRWLFSRQSARGGEVRVLSLGSQARSVWQEVPAEWFEWEVVISVPFRDDSRHINVCEASARQLAIRWRARQAQHHGSRFLHLLDSHVNLAHAAKGRGSSLRMRHVELKTNATLLASRMRDINGYTRSDRNPADAASRDKRRWADDRRQRRRAASAPRQPESAAPAPLRRPEPLWGSELGRARRRLPPLEADGRFFGNERAACTAELSSRGRRSVIVCTSRSSSGGVPAQAVRSRRRLSPSTRYSVPTPKSFGRKVIPKACWPTRLAA